GGEMIGEQISANTLDEWIGLFLPNLQADGSGGVIEKISTNVQEDRPAAVQFNSGRESYLSGQQADRYEYAVWIRFEPGITTKYRLSWRSRFYDIVSVDPTREAEGWLYMTI